MKKSPLLTPARRTAFDSLKLCLRQGVRIQAALNRSIDLASLSAADRGLATELAYGYLRYKGRLDYCIDAHLSKPGGVQKDLRLILGLAAYEILHLDKIPNYTSVSWAVDFCKKRYGKKLGGLTNALLRNICSLDRSYHDPDFYGQSTAPDNIFLSRIYSAPVWLVDLFISSFNRNRALAYLKAGLEKPPVGLRINPLAQPPQQLLHQLGEELSVVKSMDYGLAVAPPAGPELNRLIHDGLISRQSLASQEALLSLRPDDWPRPVWDCCAGHGGKTFFLHEKGIGPVMASDLNWKRLCNLKEEAYRLGFPVPVVFAADASRNAPLNKSVGTALIDAPCSGLGVLARNPDIKWRRTKDELRKLNEVQAKILRNVFQTVRPGGTLAYLTCTLNPAENESMIRAFLKASPKAELINEWTTDPDSLLHEFFWSALIKKT